MPRTNEKHLRQTFEYTVQVEGLHHHEEQFRKIARRQLQEAAMFRLARQQALQLQAQESGTGGDPSNAPGATVSSSQGPGPKGGVRSLRMTSELCGLLRKINRTRKMLRMRELAHGHQLLRKS
jgi:hypothetical protein